MNPTSKLAEGTLIAIENVINAAKQNTIHNINISDGIAEMTFNGITYQLQVSLISDKKIWAKENECLFSECVKIHK
ncbi:MAG: hypothetical protein WC390_07400 [Sulfurimonas sp.]|jgi:hypothetical protein